MVYLIQVPLAFISASAAVVSSISANNHRVAGTVSVSQTTVHRGRRHGHPSFMRLCYPTSWLSARTPKNIGLFTGSEGADLFGAGLILDARHLCGNR